MASPWAIIRELRELRELSQVRFAQADFNIDVESTGDPVAHQATLDLPAGNYTVLFGVNAVTRNTIAQALPFVVGEEDVPYALAAGQGDQNSPEAQHTLSGARPVVSQAPVTVTLHVWAYGADSSRITSFGNSRLVAIPRS